MDLKDREKYLGCSDRDSFLENWIALDTSNVVIKKRCSKVSSLRTDCSCAAVAARRTIRGILFVFVAKGFSGRNIFFPFIEA